MEVAPLCSIVVDTTVQVSSDRDLHPAMRSDLTLGKKVFVVATPTQQGAFLAQRVMEAKDGLYRQCNGLGRNDESAGRIKP
jgi:hypothetical protein